MLSDERIRQIAAETVATEDWYNFPADAAAHGIRAALAEAAQVPVMGDAVALREFADEVKQLCKDFSDRHNRPYMGDVTAAIDGLLAQFVAGQTSHATQAELDALRKDAERYRWLRDGEKSAGTGMTDEAIDAHIAKERQP